MFGPDDLQAACDVSRETIERLEEYVALLGEWNTRHNLVSRASLADVWQRHIFDSAQLAPLIPADARSLVDLGSGAGFPGLVIALLLRDRQEFRTVLFEATRKKADFLAAAAGRLGVQADIRNDRIEAAARECFDTVTARACAPLHLLLEYASRFQGARTLNLFLKGQNIAVELTEARKSWGMGVRAIPSRSDPSGVVLIIEHLRRAGR